MKVNIFKIHSVRWDGESKAEEVVLEHIETGNKTTLKTILKKGSLDLEHWVRSWRQLCKQASENQNCESCKKRNGERAKEECEQAYQQIKERIQADHKYRLIIDEGFIPKLVRKIDCYFDHDEERSNAIATDIFDLLKELGGVNG